MKIIVLGGFLGAGKTTVLMPLARYLIERAAGTAEYPVVILENEISEAGVDNQLLRQNSFTVENIFAGCICCTSSAALIYGVREIREKYDPSWLLIEATGMADPRKIVEELEGEGYEAGVLALADAKRWRRMRLALETFIRQQMEKADVILLNKVDIAKPEDIYDAETDLHACSPAALVLRTCALEEKDADFWGRIVSRLDKEAV